MAEVVDIHVPPVRLEIFGDWDRLAHALLTGVNSGFLGDTLDSGAREAFLRVSRVSLYRHLEARLVSFVRDDDASPSPTNDQVVYVAQLTAAVRLKGRQLEEATEALKSGFYRFADSLALPNASAYLRLHGTLETNIYEVGDASISVSWKQRFSFNGRADEPARREEAAAS